MTTETTQLNYQPYLEALTAFASDGDRREELLAAKAEYFQQTGELFEDDRFFELRMASFLDHFLFDRKSSATGSTPAQSFLALKRAESAPDAGLYEGFTQTIHGLFVAQAAKTPEENAALAGTFQALQERMSLVADEAHSLAQAAEEQAFLDVARQADSLRQQLLSARNKMSLLQKSFGGGAAS